MSQPSASTLARLTASGPAAVAILQLRGTLVDTFSAAHLRSAHAPHQPLGPLPAAGVRRALLCDGDDQRIDDILLTLHGAAPREVRLHLHGVPATVARVEALLIKLGFTPAADPGALWTAQSLIEADAWRMLGQMRTTRGVEWLLHQARELPRAIAAALSLADPAARGSALSSLTENPALVDWFSRPVRIALVGSPNAGKSSIANALARQPVALVSDIPGTTRDVVEFPGELVGFPAVWMDTAGLRTAAHPVEAEGVRRALAALSGADGGVLVIDVTAAPLETITEHLHALPRGAVLCIALNKMDHLDHAAGQQLGAQATQATGLPTIGTSAASGAGLCALEEAVLAACGRAGANLNAPCAFTPAQRAALSLAAAAPPDEHNNIIRKLL